MNDWNHIRSVHGAALARVVASYAAPGPDREELGQEVALAVVRALPNFRGEASLKTYVLRIAHNVGMRHAVRRRARQTDPEVDVADSSASPDQVLEASRDRERLHAAIRRLPIGQRQVLALALEELSHREIGTALGISENAVATRLHRAKTELRTLLGAS